MSDKEISLGERIANKFTGGGYSEMQAQLSELSKSNSQMKKGIDGLFTELQKAAERPTLEQLYPGRSVPIQTGGEQPPIGYLQMYQMVDQNYVLDQVINERSKQAFRKADRAEFVKRFESKCASCGAEYPDRVIDECEVCNSPDIIEPDPTQLTRDVTPGKNIREFLKECNYNDQRFLDVLKLCFIDEDTVDTGFLIMPKDYVLDQAGNILGYEAKEVIRGDPNSIWPIVDKWGVPGGKYWKCLKEECAEEPAQVIVNRAEAYATRCKCGGVLHEVHFVGMQHGQPKAYYVKGEVYSWRLHNPGLFAGKSPLIALERVCRSLVKMVEHVWLTYEYERPPKGVLLVPTVNPASVNKFWMEQMDIAKMERNYFPVVAVDGEKSKPAFVSFSGSMEELQYLQTLEEFRRAISARYSVTLIFQADNSASGGLNNEGLQITVTNRAVDDIHSNLHANPMRWTLDELRVTHWDYRLPKNEEQDEMAEIQRTGAEITNATAMLRMGYVGTIGQDGRWEFEHNPEKAGELLALGQAQEFGGVGGGLEGAPGEEPLGGEGAEGSPPLPSLNLSKIQKACPPGKHQHPGRTDCHPAGQKHRDKEAQRAHGGIGAPVESKRDTFVKENIFGPESIPQGILDKFPIDEQPTVDDPLDKSELLKNLSERTVQILGETKVYDVPFQNGGAVAAGSLARGWADPEERSGVFIGQYEQDAPEANDAERDNLNFTFEILEDDFDLDLSDWKAGVETLTDQDFLESTIIHEKGHLATFEDIGDYIKDPEGFLNHEVVQKYINHPSITEYLEDRAEDDGAIGQEGHPRRAYLLGELLAEDFRAIKAGDTRNGFILNKHTELAEDDFIDQDSKNQRLNILREGLGW
jgi:hypothetical protein